MNRPDRARHGDVDGDRGHRWHLRYHQILQQRHHHRCCRRHRRPARVESLLFEGVEPARRRPLRPTARSPVGARATPGSGLPGNPRNQPLLRQGHATAIGGRRIARSADRPCRSLGNHRHHCRHRHLRGAGDCGCGHPVTLGAGVAMCRLNQRHRSRCRRFDPTKENPPAASLHWPWPALAQQPQMSRRKKPAGLGADLRPIRSWVTSLLMTHALARAAPTSQPRAPPRAHIGRRRAASIGWFAALGLLPTPGSARR